MTLKEGFKQYNTDYCLLYRVNELGNVILILCVDNTPELVDKPELMYTLERFKKNM